MAEVGELNQYGYAERIFGLRGSAEEREKALGLTNQFLPNNVVDIAHKELL